VSAETFIILQKIYISNKCCLSKESCKNCIMVSTQNIKQHNRFRH